MVLHRLKKVGYSSFGVEFLAAADGDDRGYLLKMIPFTLFAETQVKHRILIDSKSSYESIIADRFINGIGTPTLE